MGAPGLVLPVLCCLGLLAGVGHAACLARRVVRGRCARLPARPARLWLLPGSAGALVLLAGCSAAAGYLL